MSADSPTGRFFGKGARFMANAVRTAEIPRNRHLIGANGMFGHLGPMANFVGSSGNPENIGRSQIRQPAGSTAKRRCLSQISRNIHLLGANGGFSTSRTHGRLRRKFGESRKCRLFADTPAGRTCGEGGRFTPNPADGLEVCTLIST